MEYKDWSGENLNSCPHLHAEVEGLLPQRWSCEGPEAESRPSQSHCRSDSMGGSGPEQQEETQYRLGLHNFWRNVTVNESVNSFPDQIWSALAWLSAKWKYTECRELRTDAKSITTNPINWSKMKISKGSRCVCKYYFHTYTLLYFDC